MKSMTNNEDKREAEKGSGGPKPAAASGGNRQAERRESQGVPLAARLCEFPGLWSPGRVLGAAAPNVPHREAIKEKSSQGAKRDLTVGDRTAQHYLRVA